MTSRALFYLLTKYLLQIVYTISSLNLTYLHVHYTAKILHTCTFVLSYLMTSSVVYFTYKAFCTYTVDFICYFILLSYYLVF